MSGLTPEEIEGMVKAMSLKPLANKAKIPLRPPGSYGTVAKVAFSPLEGEKPSPLAELAPEQRADFDSIKVDIEVVFGRTKLNLRELAALEEGYLLPFDDLCDDLVDIYMNGVQVGRGEIVTVDGQFGVKIISFTKK